MWLVLITPITYKITDILCYISDFFLTVLFFKIFAS